MPLASRFPAQEQAKHSQILSLSLSSHLGNGNLYPQSVGAGGEHEILKSTSLYSPPPSLPGLPALSLPTPPLTLFNPGNALRSGLPVCKSNIPTVSDCRAPHAASLQLCSLFTFLAWHNFWPVVTQGWENTSFSGSRPSCILKQNTPLFLGEGAPLKQMSIVLTFTICADK